MRFLPRSRGGVLWRAALAAVLVIGFTAGTTAVAGLLQLKQIVQAIDASTPLSTKGLTPPSPGAPQTLLLIGVDHRAGQGSGPGNTDTMMLVHIDDSSSTINLLSIPRDLGVQIPGAGFEKINAAYADGGERLLLQTIRNDVFPGLQVNHVLIVDFQSFANLITSIGCVWSDIDHRYYNDNNGLNPADNFSNINIEPGYQDLCGDNGAANSALAFVRFRHNDSDLVRESRQQDFLEWAKSQFSGSELLAKQGELEADFGKDVKTDNYLHSVDGVDELFGLAFNADGSTVKAIPFPAGASVNSAAIGDYLTFSEAAAEGAYQTFITPTTAPTQSSTPPATGGKKHRHHHYVVPVGMVPGTTGGRAQAAQLGNPGLPVYYPGSIPGDYTYCFTITANCDEGIEPTSAYTGAYPRRYLIQDGGKSYPSWVMTLVLSSGGYTDMGTGEYFTVQGTTWQDPPLLHGEKTVQVVNGKTLYEYSQGGNVTVVAWHTKQAVYWVSNTLQNDIPSNQLIAMAATFTPMPR